MLLFTICGTIGKLAIDVNGLISSDLSIRNVQRKVHRDARFLADPVARCWATDICTQLTYLNP